ncbi:MAG: hypothetical protein IPJ34_15495 [Myxococcales bacterium]|nr:hypothetical protein [Myxococcales bacterium]
MRLLASLLTAATFATTAPSFAQETLSYDPEQPVPSGYHVEERPRLGLIISGAVLTGIGAGFVAYGFGQRSEERDKTAALRANDPTYQGSAGHAGSSMSFVFGGVFAAVGLPLLIVGLSSKKKVLVSDTQVKVAPVVGKGFAGIGLSGTF